MGVALIAWGRFFANGARIRSASPAVTTRLFDFAHTGANIQETILTPDAVRSRGIKRCSA